MPTYLVTTGRDKIDRVHRTTCKKAQANPEAKQRNLSDPGGRTIATCCKPTFLADASAKTPAPAKAAAAAKKATPKKATTPRKTAAPKKATTAKKVAAPKKATPAKRPAAKTSAEPTIPDVANAREAVAAGADPHPGKRDELAASENKAARRARSEGEPIPPTPNASFVAKEYADGVDADKRKELVKVYEAALRGERASGGRGTTVQFYRNGKAVPASQNRFSSLAYWYTRGIDGDAARISTKAFREIVTRTCGVTDPQNEAWSLTLANGEALEAKLAG